MITERITLLRWHSKSKSDTNVFYEAKLLNVSVRREKYNPQEKIQILDLRSNFIINKKVSLSGIIVG